MQIKSLFAIVCKVPFVELCMQETVETTRSNVNPESLLQSKF